MQVNGLNRGEELTNDSTLVTVHGSGSRYVLFHNVQEQDWRATIVVDGVSDAEEYLPRKQVREERWRGREERVLLQELLHAGSEGTTRCHFTADGEREEVTEICRNSSLHPLHRPPVHHHTCFLARSRRVISNIGAWISDLGYCQWQPYREIEPPHKKINKAIIYKRV